MHNSIFHPSGNPSLVAVRELMALLPNALVISDVETQEVLAYTQAAVEMFDVNEDGWFQCMDFHVDPKDGESAFIELQQSGGKPIRTHVMMRDSKGNIFPTICRLSLNRMAGRTVFVVSIERGYTENSALAVQQGAFRETA